MKIRKKNLRKTKKKWSKNKENETGAWMKNDVKERKKERIKVF